MNNEMAFPLTAESVRRFRKRLSINGRPLLLGITGGIASGKSTVSKMLEAMGCPLIDFDVLARTVVRPGQPALALIVQHFGKEVLQADGTLDRKRLSDIVFQDPEKRKRLENITHPMIFEAFFKAVETLLRKTEYPVIQVAIPLLIEIGFQVLFDRTVLVYIPATTQIQRLMERDRISADSAKKILAAQMPIEDKIRSVDIVIDNQGSLNQTRRQVEKIWRDLIDMQTETFYSTR